MNTNRWLLIAFGLLLLGAGADLAYHYPRLPEQLASHFDAHGQPNGWMGKGQFLIVHLALLFVLTLSFPGMLLFLPVIPNSMINLPNKEFWMAPERVASTRATISSFLLEFGIITLFFMATVMHWVMRANLTPGPQLGSEIWIGLGVFLALDLVLFLKLMLKFKIPKFSA